VNQIVVTFSAAKKGIGAVADGIVDAALKVFAVTLSCTNASIENVANSTVDARLKVFVVAFSPHCEYIRLGVQFPFTVFSCRRKEIILSAIIIDWTISINSTCNESRFC
jgi:hypothetical protein